MSIQRPTSVSARLHRVNRSHLDALTDGHPIVRGPNGAMPQASRGEHVDDAARTLEVDLLHAGVLDWPAVAESAERSLTVLEAAFDESTGRFRSSPAIDGAWLDEPASNESTGRIMLALGQVIHEGPETGVAERARTLFDRALPRAARVTSVRAQGSVVLACLAATSGPAVAAAAEAAAASTQDSPLRRRHAPRELDATIVMRTLATDLHARVQAYARPGWPWPESVLACENAVVPRAMILAGDRLGARVMLGIGLQVMDWLIDVQTAAAGHLSPVGDTSWEHGAAKPQFDQRPAEVTSLLLAAEAAFQVTGKARYVLAMERAYAWFLGSNDLGAAVAVPARGACRDGLTPSGASANEGFESTLMWLVALEHIRSLRASMATASVPPAISAAGLAPSRPHPKTSLVATAGS